MQLPYAELGAKTLSLTVYDFDRFSKHDHIGQVVIPLNSVDLGRVVEEWRVLVSPVHDEKVRRVNFTRSVELLCNLDARITVLFVLITGSHVAVHLLTFNLNTSDRSHMMLMRRPFASIATAASQTAASDRPKRVTCTYVTANIL